MAGEEKEKDESPADLAHTQGAQHRRRDTKGDEEEAQPITDRSGKDLK